MRVFRMGRLQFLIISFLLILVLGFFGFILLQQPKCQRITCISFGKEEFQLQDVYEEEKGSVYRASYVLAGRPEASMRVDVREAIDAETALDYVRGRVAGMKALYENIRSPYPGLLTNEIRCDQEFKPTYETFVTEQGIEVQEIVGYLNDRMTFGSCERQQIHFKGTMLLFACPDRQQLYQIEFISSIEAYDLDAFRSISRSVACV